MLISGERPPGARVTFAGNGGERLTGTLMKFNRKVVIDDGRRWNIAPQLLSVAAQGCWQEQGHRYRQEATLKITTIQQLLSSP